MRIVLLITLSIAALSVSGCVKHDPTAVEEEGRTKCMEKPLPLPDGRKKDGNIHDPRRTLAYKGGFQYA